MRKNLKKKIEKKMSHLSRSCIAKENYRIQFSKNNFIARSQVIRTMFENHPKCRIWIFQFWHFPPIFVLLKLTCLVTLFDRNHQVFKKSPKLTIFGIFHELLSTQNVNVARFARNVEYDFWGDFQTLCRASRRMNVE